MEMQEESMNFKISEMFLQFALDMTLKEKFNAADWANKASKTYYKRYVAEKKTRCANNESETFNIH
ncbi:hypothetical protein [Cytobacillus purgationiresistens]|uniref:Uncharacterized protein n=1 Tax=Cytobacillus purgationiresistens TaxID=863449 RepID=A0ABU0ACD9_9BACI|nr:hypothetical protein [Cytobacillus purgationiresistens]MDQ0268919.1 hypothetical protein [Cytobacillus purgationiresistens]